MNIITSINNRLLLINIKSISHIKQVIFTGILILATLIGFSQNVGISAAGAPADNSAGLDVNFTNKGLLIPRVNLTSTTDIATITTPATSLLVYNINAGMVGGSIGYWYWDGSIWMKLGSGAASTGWSLTGNASTTVGTNFIGTTDAQDFAIYTNSAERMRVQSGGNVGIGITSPKRLLHVAQNSSGTPSIFALDNVNTTDGNGLNISFRGTTTGVGAASFKEFATIQAKYETHEEDIRASSLIFFTCVNGSINERMRISTAGYVGVRTSTPNSYLEVNGSFATAITKTTSSLTLNETHYTIIVTGGTPAVTLPVAGATNNRRSYRIINQNSSAITISSYIGFTGSSVLSVPGNSKIEVQSDGANWFRVD